MTSTSHHEHDDTHQQEQQQQQASSSSIPQLTSLSLKDSNDDDERTDTTSFNTARSLPIPAAPFLHARNSNSYATAAMSRHHEHKYKNYRGTKLQRIPSISLTESAMHGNEDGSLLYGSSLMHGTDAEETASLSFRDYGSNNIINGKRSRTRGGGSVRVGMARSVPIGFAYSSSFLHDNHCNGEEEEFMEEDNKQQHQLSTSLTAMDMLHGSGFSLNVDLDEKEVESVRSMNHKTRMEMASYADVDRFKIYTSMSGTSQTFEKVSESDIGSEGEGTPDDNSDDCGGTGINAAEDEPFDFEL